MHLSDRRLLLLAAAMLAALLFIAPQRLVAQSSARANCLPLVQTPGARPGFSRAPQRPPRAIYRASGLRRGAFLVAPSNAEYAVAVALHTNPMEMYAFGRDVPYAGDAHYDGPPVLPVWTTAPLDIFVWTTGDRAPAECVSTTDITQFRAQSATFILLIYLGSLAALLLYNLALAIATREPITGWYSAYLASLVFYQSIRDNMYWGWFLPIGPIPENLLEFSAFLFNLLLHAQFGRAFLQTRLFLPRVDRLLRTYMILLVAYFAYIFTADRLGVLNYNQQPLIVLALILFVAVTLVVGAIVRLRMGYRPALLFLISYPVLFFFTLLAVVHWATGISSPILLFSAEIGTLTEAILLSFAVGARLRNERELRELVQSMPEAVVRIDRRGRILFATPQLGALLHRDGELTGRNVRELVDGRVARDALRKALRDTIAVDEFTLRVSGQPQRFAASIRAEREHGRVHAFAVSLRAVADASRGDRRYALQIAVMQGLVLREGSPIEVATREFELLAALVIDERSPSRSELHEMLWPGLTEAAAENALDVALSRLRKRLGYRGSVRSTRAGVLLDRTIGADVRDARDALRSNDIGVEELARVCTEFARPFPVALLAWDWFTDRVAEIERLRRDLLLRLIGCYETRGDLDLALATALRLQHLDPTDESGYAAAMRIYDFKGDHGSAERTFRDCRRMLWQHLGVEPSAGLLRAAAEIKS
jgi:DNA-binding SARP family transcriptional activator/PAS domain-containing protein